MSRFQSDAIDEACEENLGHTNWGYADTQDLENIIAERKGDIPKGKEIDHIVIFYKASDICPKCDVHEIDCECEEENEDG